MIRLTTLGRLELSDGEGSEFSALLTQPKGIALVVYLALPAPGTMHRRDTLLGLLWPELDQARARTALRTALSHIRHVLGQDVVVRRGDEEVGLNPHSIACDVTLFDAAIKECEWDTALGLYRGHFLEGFFLPDAVGFERWVEDERTRLREAAAGAAWALAHQHIEASRPVEAERTAQRALSLVPTDESEVGKFIIALAAGGDRASAVGFFEKFAQRLRDDYELEPSPETVAVVETVRRRGVSAKRGRDTSSELDRANEGAVSEAPIVAPTTTRRSRLVRRWVVGAGVAVVIAAIIAVIAVVIAPPRGSGHGLDPNHVVVAVFRNGTGDPSLDRLGERVGHWITQGLQQVAIPITPWSQVMQSWEYIQTEAEGGRARDPVRELAEETGAGIVVSGSVYLVQGDSLELQTEVANVARGRVLGIIEPLRAPREFESEIIINAQQRVMGLLALSFDEKFSDLAITIGGPPSFAAYQAYRMALTRHLRGDFVGAEQYFQRAAELDTTWAQPLIRLAKGLENVGKLAERDSVLGVLERFEGRLSAYEEADLQAYRATLAGDLEGNIAHLRRAIELAPGSPAVYNLALSLRVKHGHRESVELLETLNPERGWVREMSMYWGALTQALHGLGQYERELDGAVGALEQYPGNVTAYFLAVQARALAALGRIEELHVVLDRIENEPNLLGVRHALRWSPQILRANGHIEAAQQVAGRAVDWFEKQRGEDAAAPGQRASYGVVLYLAGRSDDALRVFDALVDEYPDDLIVSPASPPSPRAARGFIAAIRGDTTQALSDIEWFQSADTVGLPSMKRNALVYYHGVIAGALGDRERAVELISESGRYGGSFIESLFYDPLRDYPPFQILCKPKG
jgi:DNA-binding SARP family transcriptional activator